MTVSTISTSMERWRNKIAVVTAASAAKGAATCKALAESGQIVIGLARNLEQMETLVRPTIRHEFQHNFYCHKCDVNNEKSVKETFAWIVEKFGSVDILITSNDIAQLPALLGLDSSETEECIRNKRILGAVYCVREALHSMKRCGFDGHSTVLVGSRLGPNTVSDVLTMNLNIFVPSKL